MRSRKIEMPTPQFATKKKGDTHLLNIFNYAHNPFRLSPNDLHLRPYPPPKLRIPLTLQHYILIPQHLQIRFNKSNLLIYNLVHLILQPTRNIPELFLAVTPVVVEEGRGAEFACDEVLAAAVAAGT
jgi:hypothetical protein